MSLSQQAQWYLAGRWPVSRKPAVGCSTPCPSAMAELVAAGLAVEAKSTLGADEWRLTPAGRAHIAGKVMTPTIVDAVLHVALGAELAPKKPRLTRAQSKRVRELVEDEGSTRAEAIAWVTAFEDAS